MNFSGYFCLIAAALLVVFAQQSEAGNIFDKITNYIIDGLVAIENKLDPGIQRSRDTITFIKQRVDDNLNGSIYVDPSIVLREGFINASNIISSSRIRTLDGVLAAEKIVDENPEGARKLTQQAWMDGQLKVYEAGTPFFKALGEALVLSNDGARQGLLSASKSTQKGAMALLDIIESGERLFNEGSEAGGRAADVSLKVFRSAIETAYAGVFYSLQKSTNESLQALRDAQSRPMLVQIGNPNCEAAAKNDPEGSDAFKDIRQVVRNALRNGANRNLVQELEKLVKCSIDSFLQITVEGNRMLANTKAIAEIDTLAATTMFSKKMEFFKNIMNQLAANLYLGIGAVYAKSGNQADNKIQPGLVVLEKGNVKVLNAIQFCKQIVETGLRNGGDASLLAIETSVQSINLAKIVLIQSIVDCARIVFSLL